MLLFLTPPKNDMKNKNKWIGGGSCSYWVATSQAKLGSTNSTWQQQGFFWFVCVWMQVLCICTCALANIESSSSTPPPACHLQAWMARLSTLVLSSFFHPSVSSTRASWLGCHWLGVGPCLSVCRPCHLAATWVLTSALFSLLSSRNGQEGWSQTNARVVQAGSGEECSGPLWVRTHDIVSTPLDHS